MDGTKEFTGTAIYRSERDTSVEPKVRDDESTHTVDTQAIEAADAFYTMFKSACHGITRRQELDQLYNATYLSFGSKHEERPEFSKVLFAMARTMKVLRVIRGGTISWKAFSHQDEHRDDRQPRFDQHRRDDYRDDRRPRFDQQPRDDRRDDRRPRFDQQPRDDRRDDRHPRFDQQPRDDRRDDRRPRFDQQPRDDRSAYYGNHAEHERRDDRNSTQSSSQGLRAVSIERQ